MIASIDLSLRSTGVCIMDWAGKLIDAKLFTPSAKEWNDEELLMHIAESITEFLKKFSVSAIAIEGLSFNSFSSEKDKINGNFWHLRCALKEAFPEVPIGIIPVNSWRNHLLSKEEQREIKKSAIKDAIKKACVLRLPKEVEEAFSHNINANKHPSKCIYDLTDAYFLGKFRLSLED
jgi:hypothetical protein